MMKIVYGLPTHHLVTSLDLHPQNKPFHSVPSGHLIHMPSSLLYPAAQTHYPLTLISFDPQVADGLTIALSTHFCPSYEVPYLQT